MYVVLDLYCCIESFNTCSLLECRIMSQMSHSIETRHSSPQRRHRHSSYELLLTYDTLKLRSRLRFQKILLPNDLRILLELLSIGSHAAADSSC